MIVAGFGFRKAVTADSLRDAYLRAGGGIEAAVLATPEDKAKEPTFMSFARGLGMSVHAVSSTDIAAQATRTQSEASRTARDTGSVAEAAALAAAGPGARLVRTRVISADRMATCALAEGDGA